MPSFFQSTRFLILALVGCSILALLAVSGLAGLGVRHVSHLEDSEVLEGISLIEGAYQLKTAAIQEVLAVRDFALLGNPGFLVNAHAQSHIYDVTFESFSRLDPHPEDAQLLQELRALDLAFETFEGQLKALKERGLEQAAVNLLVTEGKPLIDRWVIKLDTLIARQEHHVANVHRGVVQTENQIFVLLSSVSMTAIPLAVLLGGLVLWRFLRPLAELEAASRAIAAGHMDVRVNTRRDDEFGAVGRAFNTMAGEVQASLTDLTAANEQLVRVDRYKDEFLSIVSHELRTPLSFIKGFAGVLDTEMAGPLTREQREYVGNIVAGADRMLLLVTDLLDLATIQAGKLTLSVQLQPFQPVIREVLASMKPLADEKEIALSGDGPVEPPVPIDHPRVLQVLTNLVANAIKFTPAQGQVTVTARWQGPVLRVEVTDTGMGIAAEDLGKLFQRFSQLDMSVTRRAGGTGLGLSICKALVEAHGGTIGVTSEQGRGSTFWFELPSATIQ
ncbi:MAG: integral rane sensor signal transduction histidine kinase [Cyanobacteria bacterium RYN_339]|nr:integral rane sensor signal transduction histidine kinase [Cyanobacteria bacterium RYN_339]